VRYSTLCSFLIRTSHSSLADHQEEVGARRRRAEARYERQEEDAWVVPDLQKVKFVRKTTFASPFAVLNFSRTEGTLINIFEHFITEDILNGILDRLEADSPFHWQMAHGARNSYRMQVDANAVRQALAIQIYVTGQQNRGYPHSKERPLRIRTIEVKEFLESQTDCEGISAEKAETIIHRFWIDQYSYDVLSAGYQSALLSLGEAIAGDEKLSHFTGNSAHIYLVLNKPAKIGLWIFELCAKLGWDNLPFMVDMYMREGRPKETDPTQMVKTVERWARVAMQYERQQSPILFMDSLYFDRNSRYLLAQKSLCYAASVKRDRIAHLETHFGEQLDKVGECFLL